MSEAATPEIQTPEPASTTVVESLTKTRDALVEQARSVDAVLSILTPQLPDEPDVPDDTDEDEDPTPDAPLPPVEPMPPVDPSPVEPLPVEPAPKPPPPITGVFKAVSRHVVKPLSGQLPAMVSALQAHKIRAKRWPNPEGLMARIPSDNEEKMLDPATGKPVLQLPAISQKGMRQYQSYLHEAMLETAITQDYRIVYKISDLVLQMRSGLVDRSLPIPGTNPPTYSKEYQKAVARAKALLAKTNPKVTDEEAAAWADQPGLLRMLYYLDDTRTPTQFGYSNYHLLEESLIKGTLAENAAYLKMNDWLGEGRNTKAYEFLMQLIQEHVEPRSVHLAKLYYGPKAKPWYAIKALFHASLSHASYYSRMYQLTGEKYWSDQAEEIWAAIKQEIVRITLPDGRPGWVRPHYVNPITLERDKKRGGDAWHNTVYLSESAPRVLIDALLGGDRFGGFALSDTTELANTLYHTLFKYGWDGKKAGWKVAGDMGGGGFLLPKAERSFVYASGQKIPTPGPGVVGHAKSKTGGKVEDFDSFIGTQRGMVLIGAAYTDIPDYEKKLQGLRDTSTDERRGTHMPLMLFEAKRQGKLPKPL